MCKLKKKSTLFEEKLDLFTAEDKEKLLTYFNTATIEQLRQNPKIKINKSENIVKFREEHGDFESLINLIDVQGIGITGAILACQAYLNQENYVSPIKTRSVMKSIHPVISQDTLEAMKDVVTLNIEFDSIFWSKINRQLHVEDWRQTMIFDSPVFKFDHALLSDQVNEALEEMPEASLYVMEQRPMRYPNLKVVPFLVNLQILRWVIITTLNVQHGKNVVYTIQQREVDKMFGLEIGGERVSSKHIIMDIAAKKLNRKNGFFNDVQIPNHLMMNYLQCQEGPQEKFSSTLLTGLAFLKNSLYRNA